MLIRVCPSHFFLNCYTNVLMTRVFSVYLGFCLRKVICFETKKSRYVCSCSWEAEICRISTSAEKTTTYLWKSKIFQVLSLHYIHSSNTFFPPKRQVIRANRTDKLLFSSLLIFRNSSLEIFKQLFQKTKRLINRSSSIFLAPITCLLGGKKIDN